MVPFLLLCSLSLSSIYTGITTSHFWELVTIAINCNLYIFAPILVFKKMFKIEFSAHSIFTVISIAAQAGFLLPKRGRSKMPSLLFLSLVRITELIMMIMTYPKMMIRLLILGCFESHVQHTVNENKKCPPLLFTTSKKKFGSQVLAAPFLVRTEATSSFTTYHR